MAYREQCKVVGEEVVEAEDHHGHEEQAALRDERPLLLE